MADGVEGTENTITLALVLLLIVAVAWIASQIPGLGNFFKNLISNPAAAIKQASDAAGGAGIPGQPGYVSPIENVNRWIGLLFGAGTSADPTVSDPGSATANEQAFALAAYTAPTPQQGQAVYTAAPVAIGNFINTAQSDPGALQLGNSPLF